MERTYFDDIKVGDKFVSLGVTFTEADIVDFALKYDPQPFHIDGAAAAKGPFGGLIASGFHTLALSFRMFYQSSPYAGVAIGSPGLEEVRWLLPVRPGDTIYTVAEVLEARPSRSQPTMGIIKVRRDTFNQRNEKVMSVTAVEFLQKRASAGSSD